MTKILLMGLLAILMAAAGVLHFARPGPFLKIVPDYLPYPLALVYISGVFEILGGVGLLVAPTRRLAAWGLVALFIAVFPANIHMAMHGIEPTGQPIASWIQWLRLPLQFVLIAWAWWYT